jgi:hypothetical protein
LVIQSYQPVTRNINRRTLPQYSITCAYLPPFGTQEPLSSALKSLCHNILSIAIFGQEQRMVFGSEVRTCASIEHYFKVSDERSSPIECSHAVLSACKRSFVVLGPNMQMHCAWFYVHSPTTDRTAACTPVQSL